MLNKIAKAFAVIEKLKALPESELKWVLSEAKLTVENNRLHASHRMNSEDAFERQMGSLRMNTLKIVGDLLDAVEIA